MSIASRRKRVSYGKPTTEAAERAARPRGVHLAHARVRVRDLERSIAFYSHFLGLRVTERVGGAFAFLTCNAAHHQVALQAGARRSARTTPGPGTVDHLAFEVRSLREFLRVYRRLRAGKIEINSVDNGISWALYFDDPDGTRLEVYLDRRGQRSGRALWRGKVRPLSERRLASAASRVGRPR
jgi:catechol 2,3-dioxygenase